TTVAITVTVTFLAFLCSILTNSKLVLASLLVNSSSFLTICFISELQLISNGEKFRFHETGDPKARWILRSLGDVDGKFTPIKGVLEPDRSRCHRCSAQRDDRTIADST
ncbi:hypothetical protein A2U01_0040358, partial [Trifolium medium]|nr:hypothetical protein [Trifolium medium]